MSSRNSSAKLMNDHKLRRWKEDAEIQNRRSFKNGGCSCGDDTFSGTERTCFAGEEYGDRIPSLQRLGYKPDTGLYEVPQDRVQFQGDCGPGSGQQFCRSSGAAGCKKKGSCISGTLLSGQGPETEELPVCPGQCSGAGGKILYHEPPGKLFPLYQVSLRKEP